MSLCEITGPILPQNPKVGRVLTEGTKQKMFNFCFNLLFGFGNIKHSGGKPN